MTSISKIFRKQMQERTSKVVWALAFLFLVPTLTRAQVGPTSFVLASYSVKFVCGEVPHPAPSLDVLAGQYATKINVHNSTGKLIFFRKKVIPLHGGQKPTDPRAIVEEKLESDQALELLCSDIRKHLNLDPNGKEFIEGFIVIQVQGDTSGFGPFGLPFFLGAGLAIDPLDVAAVYTYRDTFQARRGAGVGVSIDIEYVQPKNNMHQVRRPAPQPRQQ